MDCMSVGILTLGAPVWRLNLGVLGLRLSAVMMGARGRWWQLEADTVVEC